MTTIFPSYKVSASSSSIYVPRKQSPVTTYYIITRVDIVGTYFCSAMCWGYSYKILANKCLEMYKTCHTYIWEHVSHLKRIFTSYKIYSYVTYICQHNILTFLVRHK